MRQRERGREHDAVEQNRNICTISPRERRHRGKRCVWRSTLASIMSYKTIEAEGYTRENGSTHKSIMQEDLEARRHNTGDRRGGIINSIERVLSSRRHYCRRYSSYGTFAALRAHRARTLAGRNCGRLLTRCLVRLGCERAPEVAERIVTRGRREPELKPLLD